MKASCAIGKPDKDLFAVTFFSARVCVEAFLSPLRGLQVFLLPPTACAVGCILSSLRGWRRVVYAAFSSDIELRHRLCRVYNRQFVR